MNPTSTDSHRTAKRLAAASVFFLGCALALKLWTGGASNAPAMEAGKLPTAQVVLNGRPYTVELAQSPIERSQGLMNRPSLAEDRGMLFIGERTGPIEFWMKNTLIPLDIIFLDEQWKVVGLHVNAPPCEADPCPTYPSPLPARHVLEINGGQAHALGVKPGVALSVPAQLHRR